jgi:ABC-type polysaccharide/polyol phosphate transport system ATPase subunit
VSDEIFENIKLIQSDVQNKYSDKFETKGHSRVANSIFATLKACNSAGDEVQKSNTIGLEGVQGSGKTTVVKLLSDKLLLENDWLVYEH